MLGEIQNGAPDGSNFRAPGSTELGPLKDGQDYDHLFKAPQLPDDSGPDIEAWLDPNTVFGSVADAAVKTNKVPFGATRQGRDAQVAHLNTVIASIDRTRDGLPKG